MSSLSDRLKTATAGLHAEMEGLPFFTALADGSLPLESFIGQLRAFAVLFGTLERSAAAVEDRQVREISAVLEGRFALLTRDLEGFSDLLVPDIAPAVQCSLQLAHAIRQCGVEHPRLLVGHLYALGGTVLGNRVHLADARRIVQGAGAGDAFYAGFAERTDELWRTFAALVDQFGASAGEAEPIVSIARENFRELIAIHAALYPLPPPEERRLTATALNSEAGSHPIPDDPREVRAALPPGAAVVRSSLTSTPATGSGGGASPVATWPGWQRFLNWKRRASFSRRPGWRICWHVWGCRASSWSGSWSS